MQLMWTCQTEQVMLNPLCSEGSASFEQGQRTEINSSDIYSAALCKRHRVG